MSSFSLEARQCPDVVVADLDTKNFSNRQTVHVNEVCECVFAFEPKKIDIVIGSNLDVDYV